MSKNTALSIKGIKSTLFFIKEREGLLQAVDISIENIEEPLKANIEVKIGSQRKCTDIGMIKQGKGKYRVYVPDIREPANAEFTLIANKKVQYRKTIAWKLQKHWQVYLAHYSHHDLGYTGLPTDVLHEYDRFYDKILHFCEQTKDWPDESKFRYVVEQSWSVQHFI